MMLEWLGDRQALSSCHHAAAEIRTAVRAAFATGTLQPTESGGSAGTKAIVDAVFRALDGGGMTTEVPA
jgi:3-isopropylmalate dehydrogenase